LSSSRLAGLPVLLAVLMLHTGQGRADAWQQSGSASISTEYDSNPALSPENPVDIWRTTLEPRYMLTGKIGENEMRTGLALQLIRSSNQSLSPNTNSPSAFLDWQRQSTAGIFGLSSRYTESSTRVAEIGNATPGMIDSTRTSRILSGKWSKALSERSTISADSSYESVAYSTTSFISYASRSSGLTYAYAWSERSSPFLQMYYTDYEPTDSNVLSLSTQSVFIGSNWKFSDELDGTIKMGNSKINDTDTGVGAGTIHYTGLRTHASLSAGHQIMPSGLGGLATVDQANGSWSYALSELSNTGIDVGWQNTHLVSDIINRTAGAWLQHDLNFFWSARMYYMRRIAEQTGIGTGSSNILGVSFMYTRPDF
jgi:hypothetical protein